MERGLNAKEEIAIGCGKDWHREEMNCRQLERRSIPQRKVCRDHKALYMIYLWSLI